MNSAKSELELIDTFFYVNERFEDVKKRHIQFSEVSSINEEYLEVESEYSKFKEIFTASSNKLALEIHSRLKTTFNNWEKRLSEMNPDKGVSRSEGMISDVFLFFKIKNEINEIITLKKESSHIAFFEANGIEDSFDRLKLINFFREQIRKLNEILIINYFTIIEYYNSFQQELTELIDENYGC